MKSLEVINESKKLMKGNKLKLIYIYIYISFLGWGIVSVFTCGIGYLFLRPYIELTCVNFYDSLIDINNSNSNDNNVIVNL